MSQVNWETRSFNQVAVGEQITPLKIDITTGLIVSASIASRDYNSVHLDRDLAQQRGSKDIIMNILTTNGLVGRLVTDWAGPEALLKSVKIKLGAPNYPGDCMELTGEITDKRVDSGDNLVDIKVAGKNSLGIHVSGTVTVALPQSDAA